MSRNVVSFHYTLHDPDGNILDTSVGGEPVSYLEGAGQIIDGLEEAIAGMQPGAKARVTVPAAKGYGEHDPEQVQKVFRNSLPIEGELRVGDRFRVGSDPYAPIVTVAEIEKEMVLLDANHPLAGTDLTFDVEIAGLREASTEEIEQGHAYTPGRTCCGGRHHDDEAECCGGDGDHCRCRN